MPRMYRSPAAVCYPARMLALLLLLACAADDADTAAPDPVDTADTADTAPDTWAGPCPPDMVQVGAFCIGAYEATLEGALGFTDDGLIWPSSTTTAVATSIAGVIPTVDLSWYQASGACSSAGRHLCTVTEWQAACGASSLPWGEEPAPETVCAIPAPDGTSEWDSLQPTGSLPDCRTPAGVFDQIGNAWEWADPETSGEDGLPLAAKMGGAYYAGQGNATCTVGPFLDHPPDFSGTIATRCCVDAR